ncbi:Threonylcarbamoyl-AMP synthase [Zhongshania aliphaticivorans]|uniref:Threonylcarbamoyl-AMP synthase n=1 Tax=Zhongshania aliphaticivorans TaxID=1470434 RepID=A0A5S9PKH6_9GAMM|nr:Sua5/YciO/YrdC/YwlC family protein [Zhongshania aliphaticivorans]CAA0104591.1 Threonylcarbamoyl-AMP synthase [Zhongshania aliphaticivorans]CAA0104843.1 Threonylcarbamoyl-AMP synthase [Zhongshania aliphaticivorans]
MALLDSYRLRRAAALLRAGAVVSHPTEAVWGLACVPWDNSAVSHILNMKNRDPAKGLVLVADSVARFDAVLPNLPAAIRTQVEASWPGPHTWVVPDFAWAPSWIKGEHQSVAIRVSDHPLTSALCRAANTCLVSTSANPAGCEPARNQREVQRYFRSQVDYYLPGRTGARAQPTDICDALSGEYLRGA